MMMKLLFLACTMALSMSAQDFHGVSIGGTLQVPTIQNHANQAVYGYVLVKHSTTIPHNVLGADGIMQTTTDYSLTHNVFSADRIIYGGGIRPGDEVVPGSLVLGMTFSSVDPVTKIEVPEGATIGWEITGVLFADGTFYGDDVEFKEMASKAYLARSYARDMQYREDRENVLRQDAEPPRRRPEASFRPVPSHPQTIARTLINVREFERSQEAMDRALGRVASLPDVVKGQ